MRIGPSMIFLFVAKLFATHQDEQRLYWNLIQGGELFTQLKTITYFSEPTVQFYAAKIVLVLEACHEKQIMYRDLKSENILLDKEDNLKFINFGFDKIVHDKQT